MSRCDTQNRGSLLIAIFVLFDLVSFATFVFDPIAPSITSIAISMATNSLCAAQGQRVFGSFNRAVCSRELIDKYREHPGLSSSNTNSRSTPSVFQNNRVASYQALDITTTVFYCRGGAAALNMIVSW